MFVAPELSVIPDPSLVLGPNAVEKMLSTSFANFMAFSALSRSCLMWSSAKTIIPDDMEKLPESIYPNKKYQLHKNFRTTVA